jgi:hypothetical protein
VCAGMASYADLVRGGMQEGRSTQAHGSRNERDTPGSAQGGQNGSGSSERVNSVTETIEAVFEGQAKSPTSLHPMKAQEGEQLPPGYSRSYAGLLLKDLKREIQVNQDVVKQEMEYLQTFAVIAFFIGSKPLEHLMFEWLEKLKEHVQGPLVRGRNLGRGFFILKADDKDVVKNLLMLTPYRLKFGLCVFQWWVSDFDPNTDIGGPAMGSKGQTNGLIIPTWITLRQVKEEFMEVAKEIAARIGEVLGVDEGNDGVKDPRFCVGIPSGGGWEHSMQVTNGANNTKSTILIDYNYLPIRCRACGDTTHCLKDCPLRTGQSKFAPRQKNQEQHGAGHRPASRNAGNNNGKQPEVDSEGFQKPKYKGWRHPGPSSRGEGIIGSNSNSGGRDSRGAVDRHEEREQRFIGAYYTWHRCRDGST